MTVFPTKTARDIWTERWCDTCFEPAEVDKREHGKGGGCPIIAHAMAFDKKPQAWDRNARKGTPMDARYTCNAHRAKPDVVRRPTNVCETLPMFEVEAAPADFVPITGWPEKAAFARAKIARAKDDHQ